MAPKKHHAIISLIIVKIITLVKVWVWVGHWSGVVVIKDPCLTEFQFCRFPHMVGIKLQLLFGIRTELAVGSLPYPGKSRFPIVSPE